MKKFGSSPLTSLKLSITFEIHLRVNVHSLCIDRGGIVHTAGCGRAILSLKDAYLAYISCQTEQNISLKVISPDQGAIYKTAVTRVIINMDTISDLNKTSMPKSRASENPLPTQQ